MLKVFPVVVSEETVDKVSIFCAAKRKGSSQQPALKLDSVDQGELPLQEAFFDFGDFIRAFKVSLVLSISPSIFDVLRDFLKILSRIGYQEINESDEDRFVLMS